MRNLYIDVQCLLDKVEYGCIWPGFHQYGFALYNDEEVVFRDEMFYRTQEFVGNTSIRFRGEFISIWHIDNSSNEDIDLLASNLVHEMFHAFQNDSGDSRFPDDLQLLNYPDNLENFQIKQEENNLLVQSLIKSDTKKRRDSIERFMSYRKSRERIVGSIINEEYRAETIEGMAEYAGLCALRQISKDKYNKKLNEYINVLRSPGQLIFDARRLAYYSGAIFLIAMYDARINFYHDIGTAKGSLFEIVSGGINTITPNSGDLNIDIGRLFKAYVKEKDDKLSDFFSTGRQKHEGNFTICGYDPMNMIKFGDKLLCNHFIMLYDNDTGEKTFIDGPVAVSVQNNSTNRVYEYYL